MKLTFRIMLLTVFFSSCEDRNLQSDKKIIENKNEEFIDYYSNGQVKLYAEYKDSTLSGVYKKYYENGVLEINAIYSMGKLTNVYQEFYDNGKLKNDYNFLNNKALGTQYEYFNSADRKIKAKKVFIEFSGHLITMMNKEYDLDLRLRYDSSKVILSSDFDIINGGESKSINATLINPSYKLFRIHIGNFDRNFKLIDSVGYYTEMSDKPVFKINIPSTSHNDQYIRGFIEDYYIKDKNNNITTTQGKLDAYFEYNYFVH